MTAAEQVARWKADNLGAMTRCPNNTLLTKEECIKQQAKAARKPRWNNGQTTLNHCHTCGIYQRGRV
jgi:hypothetical protein